MMNHLIKKTVDFIVELFNEIYLTNKITSQCIFSVSNPFHLDHLKEYSRYLQ